MTTHGIPLPAELSYLGEIMPDAAVLRLIEAHGGTRIYVPKAPSDSSPLVASIGMAAAQALAGIRGGEDFKVPLARWWRARILKAGGASYPAIARALGVTERAVHGYLQAARMTHAGERPDASLQLDLFD